VPIGQIVVPARADGLQIALDAREQAWVRVKVDGNVVYESIPDIGPTVPWSAKSKISIETGNAGAFDVIVNGVRVGPLGARNTVARKVWDLSGQAKDGE
jgi:cytoskeleton protein RodZ